MFSKTGSAREIRTPVSALRGRRTGPLYDGATVRIPAIPSPEQNPGSFPGIKTTAADPQQLALFERMQSNVALPYGHVPYAARDTSVEAAVALTPRVGKWQARVLEALACRPMSDEQLELYLGCERTRTSRPRRRELELLGLVEDSGERITGIGGTHVCVWRLTAAGIEKAKELSA